ncbi:hypothetical protein Fmac_027603 [Flemingia macrophylla]|uniref:Transcription initiation factor TFIID subunit 8 n=1 Tax=Flemingia macrophylla TaxID=520843 RepID=A0ABD1LI75_9FABA
MTNGGARAAPDDFGRAAARLAAAQLCQAAGFHGATASSLDAFADFAIRYLLDLGRAAESYANHAGRSQCSIFDAIRAFEDLEAPRAFSCAGAGVREIANFVESSDEVPFAQPIPRFPVVREGGNTNLNIPSFDQMGETPPSKHIPAWLPALPDPHTYIHTSVWDERVSDPREDKIEQARQRRKAERSLLSLQKRLLLRNGSSSVEAKATTSASPDGSDVGLDPQAVGGGDDKDVPPVVKVSDEGGSGDGKRVSVLEAFGPAIEMLGGVGLCEDDDGLRGRERTELPAERPTVHFQFRTGKKFIGESLNTRLRKKDVSRTAMLAGREDERDDKKRRAEYILKQSMENPQELTLL